MRSEILAIGTILIIFGVYFLFVPGINIPIGIHPVILGTMLFWLGFIILVKAGRNKNKPRKRN